LKAEWFGRLNRDKSIKLSEADREAALTRADGDAQAARIYANAYSASPEFYSFWKAMESYRQILPGQRKVLSTDMDYFKYLYNVN
jgi:membrane protease subunit HflC